MMKRDHVIHNSRFAGMVRRYHVWPMHQTQTIGEHVFHCIRIYYMIWGSPPPDITVYFLWHDAAELVTGDLPFPVKLRSPGLKLALDVVELETLSDMGIQMPELSAPQKARTKACDYLEMWEHCNVELLCGNKFCVPLVGDLLHAIGKVPLTNTDMADVLNYVHTMQLKFREMADGQSQTERAADQGY